MDYKVEQPQPLMDFLLEKTKKKRNDIKNLLKYQKVSVDNHIETYYAYALQVGQIVSIGDTKKQTPFNIIYEDKDMIVIDKPCGLLTEQTVNEKNKTAYAMVKQYLSRQKENIYLVHRLDQYTSGFDVCEK